MFDKLKKLFVVTDEEFKEKAGTASSTDNDASSASASIPTPQPTQVKANKVEGEGDPKFLNILMSAIEKQDQEGFDYLEFKQSLNNLKGVVPDESTRFNSAIAMAKTVGASKDSIIKAGQLYLNVLKEEEGRFNQTVQSQRQRIEHEQTQGIQDLQQSIELKKKQIEQLKQEVANEENTLKESQASGQAQVTKIQTTVDQFMHAYQIVSNQILTDLQNLAKYVKE